MQILTWVSASAVNGTGLVQTTKGQYIAIVELKNTVSEAINMGGTKTIVGRDVFQDIKWEVESLPEGKSYGSYLGPRGKPTKHYRQTLWPFRIIFSPKIAVNVHKIKVVEHTDPIFLIGVDILYRGSGEQNTCFKEIQALRANYGEVEFMVRFSTQTGALHWGPLQNGNQKPIPDSQNYLKK